MRREELAKRYVAAWNQKNVSELLKLLHPQASYHDAFWGETCSGSDLANYFEANLAGETNWYRSDGELIITQNGAINRYLAFDNHDLEGLAPIHKGAEIFTMSDEYILTVSDFYCDPTPIEILEVAKLVEKRHGQSNIVPLGMSAKTSGRIKRQLIELAKRTTIYFDSSLTVTALADHVGCSVMHLFYVLEEEKETTFIQFVNECRARYAATLLAGLSAGDVRFDRIAERSGFKTITEFRDAFDTTFGMSADEYLEKFTE